MGHCTLAGQGSIRTVLRKPHSLPRLKTNRENKYSSCLQAALKEVQSQLCLAISKPECFFFSFSQRNQEDTQANKGRRKWPSYSLASHCWPYHLNAGWTRSWADDTFASINLPRGHLGQGHRLQEEEGSWRQSTPSLSRWRNRSSNEQAGGNTSVRETGNGRWKIRTADKLKKKMSILVFTLRKQCKLNNCIPFYPAQIRKIRKRLIFDSLVSERRGTTGLSYIQYMEIRIGEPLSSNSTNLEMPRMF